METPWMETPFLHTGNRCSLVKELSAGSAVVILFIRSVGAIDRRAFSFARKAVASRSASMSTHDKAIYARGLEMKCSKPIALFSAVFLALSAMPAHSQATRTWVSGVGNDVNPCSRTAPCLTFVGALAKTAVSGIIDCLDPGDFGAVTINKSITIDCEETTGGVLVPGTDGIDVATSGIVVNLRGLDIKGGGTGLVGINITQAATVYIRRSVISGFQSGNATGINASGGGTLIVNDTVVHSNGTGIVANGSASTVSMTLRDVIIHSNSSNGISITTAANANIDRSTLAYNGGTGLIVNGSSVVAMIGNSTITGNGTGVASPLGTLYSFKDNQIAGNTANGTPITAFPGPGGPLQ